MSLFSSLLGFNKNAPLKITQLEGESTFWFRQRVGSFNGIPTLYISNDDKNYELLPFEKNDDVIESNYFTINEGEAVYIKGDNPNGWHVSSAATALTLKESAEYSPIERSYSVEGDIMSLLGEQCTKIPDDFCFYGFFSDAYNIKYAHGLVLSSKTATTGCYGYMFGGRAKLITPPKILLQIAATQCCYGMFARCHELVQAPELPATILQEDCYRQMFLDCDKLIMGPKTLPALTLAKNCYSQMFDGCKNLTVIPKILATTLAQADSTMNNGLYRMFYGVTKPKEIYCNLKYNSNGSIITGFIGTSWINDLPNTSDCIFHKNPEWAGPTSRSTSTIPSEWQIVDWIQ